MLHDAPRAGARIVVLPDPLWSQREEIVRELINRWGADDVLDIQTTLQATQVCAALLANKLDPPIVVLAHGEGCQVLPAVALSMRTRHIATLGYVLIDPDAPPSTDTWPESPVIVVSTTEKDGTSLRGWHIVSAVPDVTSAITRVLAETLLD
jgi:hypothetical protein